MSALIKLLENHGIETQVRAGRVYATAHYTTDGKPGSDTVDVTGWTTREACEWLGY